MNFYTLLTVFISTSALEHDPQPVTSFRSLELNLLSLLLMLSSHCFLGLPDGQLPSFIPTKILYVFLFFSILFVPSDI